MTKKILIVFGTRPEAIKMAPVVIELQKHTQTFQTKICVTAQHREMLDQVLSIFKITPDFDLNIMKPNQDLFDITSEILLKIKDVLTSFSPDLVLVHGDTTTAFTTALAAFYLKIPVGHVEAGLRTYSLFAPWPEELNRQLVDRMCAFHFAPTQQNADNLAKERVPLNDIVVTGNTVIDALHLIINEIKTNTNLEEQILQTLQNVGYSVAQHLTGKRKLILVTGHRRENFGQGFLDICEALKDIAKRHPNVDIVYPVHLNPNVRKPVFEILANISNLFLIEPLEYLPFVYLMNKAHFIITDSGGIQEEAPGLGKPVLVMRETTERPEGVKAGTVILVGTDKDKIVKNAELLINNEKAYNKMSSAYNPYGKGDTSQIIVKYLLENFVNS